MTGHRTVGGWPTNSGRQERADRAQCIGGPLQSGLLSLQQPHLRHVEDVLDVIGDSRGVIRPAALCGPGGTTTTNATATRTPPSRPKIFILPDTQSSANPRPVGGGKGHRVRTRGFRDRLWGGNAAGSAATDHALERSVAVRWHQPTRRAPARAILPPSQHTARPWWMWALSLLGMQEKQATLQSALWGPSPA